jgi:hypothetical protein
MVTDGGVSADAAGNWVGDSGDRSATVMISYHPEGRPKLRGSNRQVGAYTDNQAVDMKAHDISNSVETMTQLFVLNYLALHGQESRFGKIVEGSPFIKNMDANLYFQKAGG